MDLWIHGSAAGAAADAAASAATVNILSCIYRGARSAPLLIQISGIKNAQTFVRSLFSVGVIERFV